MRQFLFSPLLTLMFATILLVAATKTSLAEGPTSPQAIPTTPVNNVKRAGKIDGNTYALVVNGDFVYVGIGSRLTIVNISNPAAPELVGQSDAFTDTVQDIRVAGGLAYLATGKAGLRVVDVSNPVAPVQVGVYDTPGNAMSLDIDGNFAFVADAWAGSHVINISNPALPVAVAQITTEEQDLGIRVAGNYVYIASEESGLRVVDISNLEAPVEVFSVPMPGDANGIDISGQTAYVATGNGLILVDISDPTDPVLIGSHGKQYSKRVFVRNQLVYLAAERDGVSVIDVTDKSRPVAVNEISTVGSANDVFIANEHAFIADGIGGLTLKPVGNGVTSRGLLPQDASSQFVPLTPSASQALVPKNAIK